jgi:endoglucanase
MPPRFFRAWKIPQRFDRTGDAVVISRRSALGGIAGIATLAPFRALPRAAAESAGNIPIFRRGICVSHALGWADVEASDIYGSAPFSAPRFRFDLKQRQAIRAAGFDFVRLAVDVGPFLVSEGASRDRLYDLLIDTVRKLLDADLGTIVDLHPSAMNPTYRPAMLTAGMNTPNFQAVLAMQSRLAGRLERIAEDIGAAGPPTLALELMNEPEITPVAWKPMLDAAYAAARSGSEKLPLVLGGASMNAATALAAIDTRPFAGDARLIYTFHEYAPWQFTHQGVRGSPAYALDAITYPAPASADAMNLATERRMGSLELDGVALQQAQQAKRTLAGYVTSRFDRSTLEKTFQQVTAWRTAQRLPAHAILLGEFGVHRTPYQNTAEGAAARERWLCDMRELAEANGFAWACWTYAGTGGFALTENEIGPGFDAATRRALGLVSP